MKIKNNTKIMYEIGDPEDKCLFYNCPECGEIYRTGIEAIGCCEALLVECFLCKDCGYYYVSNHNCLSN